MRLLLINPNTSVHITERLAASARAALAAGESVTAITASDSPRVVRSAADLLQADANALALADAHVAGHDALVLGISLDGAAPLLRQRHPGLPVIGMTEAALLTACLRADRLGLLTLGGSMLPLYRQRVEQIGLTSRMAGYEAPESPRAFEPGAALQPAVAPEVLDVLAAAINRLQAAGAQAVVLSGAVLCGYDRALQARCGLPVFDGVACAVAQARVQFSLRQARVPAGLTHPAAAPSPRPR